MNFWKVILATFVIYGAGVMTGGLLVNRVDTEPRNPHHADASPRALTNNPAARPPHLPDIMNKQFLQRLDAELHLTADQREAIQKIISDSQNLIHKTVQDARLEIREQLTPEQRSCFDELVKRPPRRPPNATNAPPVLSGPTNAPGF